MPGATNNTTILAAENQEIVALNEIKTAIDDLDLDVTLDVSGLETAISSLQAGLVSAINSLKSAIEALNMNVTQNNYCCGSGESTTTTCPPCPPAPGQPGGGTPGDPPTDNQTDIEGTPEEIASRRCKVAMWMIDTLLKGIVGWLDEHNIDDWVINPAIYTGVTVTSAVILVPATSAVVFVLGLFLTPGPDPIDAVAGVIAGGIVALVAYLIITGGNVDFSELYAFIETNSDKMICALHNSMNSWSAHTALMAVVDGAVPGLDPGNRNFIDRFFGFNDVFLGLLFYADDRFELFEHWLADQPDTCPCADDDPDDFSQDDIYHCKAVNYFFDGFVDSLEGWGTVSTMTWYMVPAFINALGNGMLLNLLGDFYKQTLISASVFISNFIAQLVSQLGSLLWEGGFDCFNAFDLVAADFELNKEEIICELFLAEDVEAVYDLLEGHLNTYLEAILIAHPEWAELEESLKSAITDLLPNTALNILFEEEERAEITAYDPEDFVECTECGGGCDAFFQNMANDGYTCTKLNDTDFEAVYNVSNGRYEVIMAVNHDPDDHTSYTNWTGPMMVVGYEVLAGTIDGITPPPSPIRFFDQASNSLGGGSDPQPPTCFGWVIMVADNQFTVRFECVSECP